MRNMFLMRRRAKVVLLPRNSCCWLDTLCDTKKTQRMKAAYRYEQKLSTLVYRKSMSRLSRVEDLRIQFA